MTKREEIIRNLWIIFCAFILAVIPWASVFGIQDPVLLGATREFQRIGFLLIGTAMALKIFYQIYEKPLTQDMKEEEIREADQKDGKQLLFKPTTGVLIFFILFIALFVAGVGGQFADNNVDLGFTIIGIGMIVFFTWMWYTIPTFTFTEDSVNIKSYLFYVLGIDRKTIIRYADITSVSPDPNVESTMSWLDRRYRILISVNGTTQTYGFGFYNSDTIAKIYLRFGEKLGDKVRFQ